MNLKSHKSGKWRKLGRGLLGLLILLGGWFDWSLWQVTSSALSYNLPDSADVIIVLGCTPTTPTQPGPCQIARTSAAVDLWRMGYASNLILTGGESGKGIEARSMAIVAGQAGVPASQVVLEEQAHNTVENLRYSKKLMAERNWQSVILVSEPYHLYRARQQAADLGLEVRGWWPATSGISWQNKNARTIMLVRDSLALMLYESTAWIASQ